MLKKCNMTEETFNEYFLVTQIMLHLYAGSNNTYIEEDKGDEELVKLIEYCLRFHHGAESGKTDQAKLHGALQ